MSPGEWAMAAVLGLFLLALLAAISAPTTFDPHDHPPEDEGSL